MIDAARLCLRPGKDSDVPGLVSGLNDWNVAQWLAHPPCPYSPEDARAFLAWSMPPTAIAPPRAYVIAEHLSDQLLGVVGLDPQDDAVELGYWLSTAYHGRGYMREAVQALLREDGRRFPATPLIYATTDPENHRSQAILTGAGFLKVGVQKRKRPTRRGSLSLIRFEMMHPP